MSQTLVTDVVAFYTSNKVCWSSCQSLRMDFGSKVLQTKNQNCLLEAGTTQHFGQMKR